MSILGHQKGLLAEGYSPCRLGHGRFQKSPDSSNSTPSTIQSVSFRQKPSREEGATCLFQDPTASWSDSNSACLKARAGSWLRLFGCEVRGGSGLALLCFALDRGIDADDRVAALSCWKQ